MKVLIRYDSKHGGAKQLSETIAKQLKANVIHVKENAEDDAYDKILCICPVYMGRMNKTMISYIQSSSHPNIGLCLVGLNVDEAEKCAKENLGEQTNKLALIKGVGGVLNFPDMGFMERRIIAMVNKQKKMIEHINTGKVYEMWREEEILQVISWVKK